jgi:predicted enzyme related to lactoylglutathione lyase
MTQRICFLLALACVALTSARGAEKLELPPLTTVDNAQRLTGKFVWADLVTDDVAAARKFYGQMFGWRFRNVGDYALAANDERPLAGILQRARPADQPIPARPRWIPYMSVSSVGEAQEKAMKAGGKVVAKQQNYPQRGDQAVFADAEGAVFGVIASRRGDPADFLAEPGDWIWVQLFSRDLTKAAEFYQPLGKYEIVPNTERTNSVVLSAKGYARAAIMTIPTEQTQVPSSWLPFVRVKSVTDSVARANELGGKVLIAPKPELFKGRVAVIADPTGAAIGIMEWSEQN